MTALRVFPFIGAAVAIGALVLGIIGVSTTYWFSNAAGHEGKTNLILYEMKTLICSIFFYKIGLWQKCPLGICIRTDGGRTAAIALAVRKKKQIIRKFPFSKSNI